MYFDPKTNRYPYPEDTDKHYLHVKKNRGIVFDETYPYIDNSKSFRFKRFWIRLLLKIIVFPLDWLRLGIKVNGKKNLKIYMNVISDTDNTFFNHILIYL